MGCLDRTVQLAVVGFALLGSYICVVSPPEATAAERPKRAGAGILVVQVEGLPRGERAGVTVVGPSQGRGEGRFHAKIASSGVTKLRKLKAGRYQLRVVPVEIRGAHGLIRRGAMAFPVRRRLKVKVKRGKSKPARVRYGTIRNPGVEELSARTIVKVLGRPRAPRGLILREDLGYRRGTLLTAEPSDELPRGLVARVTSVRSGRQPKVLLRPASIYEVAPSMDFRTKLDVESLATASGSVALSCGSGSVVEPFVRFSDVWADGGWITSNVWLAGDVKTGAWLKLDFTTAIGLEMAAVAGVTCELVIRAYQVRGRAGPVPLYGVIKPTISGRVGAGARLSAEGSVRVELGAKVDAVPPEAKPTVSFSSPKFDLSAEAFSEVGLGVGLNAEFGIGADDGANLHVGLGNSLDFSVGGGRCAWDLRLGSFSVKGKLWRWKINGPSSPPQYQRNLWQTACAPPPLPLPLNRAQIAWAGDADVDLYAWDESGRLTYFGEQVGIPDTELIEDVIPDVGQVNHEGETFRETANPGRRYTFGVCLFRGAPTDVTVTVSSVPDPRGVPRVIPVHLGWEGAGAVVATSPEGGGFSPPAGWCRSVASL